MIEQGPAWRIWKDIWEIFEKHVKHKKAWGKTVLERRNCKYKAFEEKIKAWHLMKSSSIQSAKTRPGADCGSDHELLIVKFRLKLKKVGKITRPFRYDLNQISYDYTVTVRNRFKRLDLIDNVPDEL